MSQADLKAAGHRSWPGARRRPAARRRLGLPRPRLRWLLSARALAALAALILVLGVGWLWFRGSSLVRIRRVTVTGLSGPDVSAIRGALTHSAESMTTLNLSVAKLDQAVSPYTVVRSLTVNTGFPHAVTIAVNEQVPVAEVTLGGRMIVVDSAGELLPGTEISHGLLPDLPLRSAPPGDRINAPGAQAALRVLRAAPYRFLAHIQSATWSAQHGVIVQLRQGPQVYFGPDSQLSQKWTAALAVLADSDSQGAAYIDVSDPRRPAAGASAQTTPTTTGAASTST